MLFHSWLSFLSLALSPSMESALLLFLLLFLLCRACSSSSFCSCFRCVSIIFLFSRLVSFSYLVSLFFYLFLPMSCPFHQSASLSFLQASPSILSLPPSGAKCFFPGPVKWLSLSLKDLCVTQRWFPLILFEAFLNKLVLIIGMCVPRWCQFGVGGAQSWSFADQTVQATETELKLGCTARITPLQ